MVQVLHSLKKKKKKTAKQSDLQGCNTNAPKITFSSGINFINLKQHIPTSISTLVDKKEKRKKT